MAFVRAFIPAAVLAASMIQPELCAQAAASQDGLGPAVVRELVPVAGSTQAGFSIVDSVSSGILFTNRLPVERAAANHNYMNGSGVALGDYDGDGRCDLYFCQLTGRNVLYRNLGGWRFQDVTEAAGLAGGGRTSTGAAFADLNGDSRLDLVLTACGGPNSVFLNQGQGMFRESALPPGEVTRTGSTSVALADIDGDGDLDLYVANYGEHSLLRSGGFPATRIVNGREEVIGRFRNRIRIREDGKMVEYGEPDTLYLNDGRGGFTPVPWTSGAFLDEEGLALQSAPWDFGLAAMFRDIDADGHPDLYVCNDFQTPDRIWINNGHGVFRALPRLALRQTSNFSMSVDFADVDRDGHFDFFLADMLSPSHVLRMVQADGNERLPHPIGEIEDRPQVRQNSLMRARGDGTFAALALYAGVQASDWTWSSIFLDVDLDGFEDLLIGNGHMFDAQDLDGIDRSKAVGRGVPNESLKKLQAFPPLVTPNLAFRNKGDLTFEQAGLAWSFQSTNVSHGMALGDLDQDGDLDVVVNCLNAPPLIYRNNAAGARVAVRLGGRGGNTAGIGAKISLLSGAVPQQSQEMIAGGRYLSGDQAMRVFAAGSTTNEMAIEVTWRSGVVSRVDGVRSGKLYEISEPLHSSGSRPGRSPAARATPWFEDNSKALAHRHEESLFNDFEKQPLLPHRFSQLGPGVFFADLDGDQHDDVWMGGGRGGRASFFRGDGSGKFKPVMLGGVWTNLPDDVVGVAMGAGAEGRVTLLAALTCYEQPPGSLGRLMELSAGLGGEWAESSVALPEHVAPGPVATGDIDGDGDLDAFVGGRLKPGRYPEPVPSMLFRRESSSWKPDGFKFSLSGEGALVTGAVFTDLNADGFPELVLACEWGPIRVFLNQRGNFKEVTEAWGLSEVSGRWTSICAADLDGDGRMDLVAGNWGLNTRWTASPSRPLEIYFGDFDGNGVFESFEAEWDSALGGVVPHRNLQIVGAAMPVVRTRVSTHRDYAVSSLSKLLGDAFSTAHVARASTLETAAWLNRGEKFERLSLPSVAQWAPVMGMSAADFDGDGNVDLFLAQNYFAMRPEDGRLDAGTGLLLRGTGGGGFRGLTSVDSGIRIDGEQRGSAVGDLDEDGRPDLIVAQNGAETRVMRNTSGVPGLRVRFSGPPGNPRSIGVSARLRVGEMFSPRQEVRGGTGCFSQDSATLVFARPEKGMSLSATWPGGKTTESLVPENAREIRVDYRGVIEKLR